VASQLSYLAQLHGLSTGDATDAVTRWTTRLGIETRVNDTLDALSLGNQQRAQLAAALVHDPDVLVLDEPFSGLDPVAVDVMSEVLAEKASQGVPVIFSSHQLELVERLCHRVGIVVRGHMQECGTVDELRAGGAAQLVVHAPRAPAGWADGLAGVHASEHVEGGTVLTLEPGADDQVVLAARCAQVRCTSSLAASPRSPSCSASWSRHEQANAKPAPGSPQRAQSGSQHFLVAKRELITRARTKSFLISNAVVLVLILAGIIVASVLGGGSASRVKLGLVGSAASLSSPLAAIGASSGNPINSSLLPDEATARARLASGALDVAVIPRGRGSYTVVVEKKISGPVRSVVESAVHQQAVDVSLRARGVNPATLAQAATRARVAVAAIHPPKPHSAQRTALALHRDAGDVLPDPVLRALRSCWRGGREVQPGCGSTARHHQAIGPAVGQGVGHRGGGLVQLAGYGVVGLGAGSPPDCSP